MNWNLTNHEIIRALNSLGWEVDTRLDGIGGYEVSLTKFNLRVQSQGHTKASALWGALLKLIGMI